MHVVAIFTAALFVTDPPTAEEPKRLTFDNPIGWEWAVVPDKLPADRSELNYHSSLNEGVMLFFDASGPQPVRAFIVTNTGFQSEGRDIEFRLVAFDDDRKRELLRMSGMSGNEHLQMIRLELPAKLAGDKDLKYVGVERLTPAGRKLVSADAVKRAAELQLETLPLPTIGGPFEFRLTCLDGKTVSSQSLRGRVVLIDGWATWCSPCMEKMPKLKSLYEKWHEKGFEIVGLNFDESPEQAKKAAADKGLTWPQVHVPADKKTRQLWYDASGVRSIPRLLLLDRSGVLREDLAPFQLEESLSALLASDAPASSPPR